MNQQEALVKLAQVRMAINHVLRTRAMQKQAEGNRYPSGQALTNKYIKRVQMGGADTPVQDAARALDELRWGIESGRDAFWKFMPKGMEKATIGEAGHPVFNYRANSGAHTGDFMAGIMSPNPLTRAHFMLDALGNAGFEASQWLDKQRSSPLGQKVLNKITEHPFFQPPNRY